MIQNNNKLQEGLESVNRMKLLMGYDMSKTLNENLNEQSVIGTPVYGNFSNYKPTYPKNTKWTKKSKSKYQEEHPEMVWDPEAFDETQPSLNMAGKTTYPKGKFVPLTPENMGLRGTPFGFDPTEYPEYLKKVKEINKKYPKSETSILNPTTWVDSDVDDTRKKLLANLKNQYYHEDFPGGIPQKDFLDRMKEKKFLTQQQKKERDSIYKAYKVFDTKNYKYNPPKITYKTGKNGRQEFELDPKTKQFIGALNSTDEKYKNLNDYLDAVYQYDPYSIKEISKSALEKFWDKWGSWVELALWVIADMLTDTAVLYLSETRQAVLLARIVKFAGKVGLPVAAGVYDTVKNEGLTGEGLMYFMFAILPWAHSYFKIAEIPSAKIVESIVSKQKGLNLRLPSDVRIYMTRLNQQEKSIFRAVARLTKEETQAGLKSAFKELESKGFKGVPWDIYRTGQKIEKTIGQKIKPSLAVKIGKGLITIAKDLTAIEAVKGIFDHFGVLDEKKEKEKALEEEFNKRKGIPLIIFMSNAIEAIRQDPKLDINGIISKSAANFFIKNGEDAIMVLLNNNMEGFLQDENGNKVDRYGEPIKK
jgi:hypothetical protein